MTGNQLLLLWRSSVTLLHHLLFCFTRQENLCQHKDHTSLNIAKAANGYPEDTHIDTNPQLDCCDALLLTTLLPSVWILNIFWRFKICWIVAGDTSFLQCGLNKNLPITNMLNVLVLGVKSKSNVGKLISYCLGNILRVNIKPTM